MGTSKRYPEEVRERAVRMVAEQQAEHGSQWAAIGSIAGKIGCTSESLRRWVRQAEVEHGERAGMSSSERERLRHLERENRELKRANEILRKASAFLPRRSSSADRSDGGVHRRAPRHLWGRADLRAAADRPVDNWGQKHTDSYAWGQVAGFDNAPDTFLECSTARLKLGPFWSPPLTVVVLRMEDREIRLNSLVQAFRAQGNFDFSSWRIESGNSQARVSMHMHAPKSAFVGLTYDNPPGGAKTCLNTKLAACELVLEQPGRPKRTLVTKNRAAFEILTERQDHAVPIVA